MAITGGVEILNKKLKRCVDENVNTGEEVEFCLLGDQGQAIVALQERLLLIKPPGFLAGLSVGVFSFPYRQISEVTVKLKPLSGYIKIWTHGGSQPMPRDLQNCMLIVRNNAPHYQPYLERLKELIVKAFKKGPNYLASRLQKIEKLWRIGVLTEAEFQNMKTKLEASSEIEIDSAQLTEKLQKLKIALAEGILTEEEFEKKKSELQAKQ